ncbi:CHAT domain-containing protein [Alkalinema sp. FACHB-956]|uniref:CHAT domain-containing protein n=1 Tax=Alkalinema sp. FACHB-956 TaxID=2692768 RepID=UPI001688E519|nr:CHAT domain-containing protein [Alkalinema sp. FACHB-956]MBD2329167.1 CHAT domain-containing protein [Alkalinema sp. FACHB-956]
MATLSPVLRIVQSTGQKIFAVHAGISCALIALGRLYSFPGMAQSIVPSNDGTATIVTPTGNQFNITGGQISGDSHNLFHSFQQFDLLSGQSANFSINPNIQNILGRIIGGNPSVINGLLQVTGGNANLVLMNPSGILFGQAAQLNVPGSFWATTANGILFGDRWFSASGQNDYANLLGNPSGFAWTTVNPGAIVNAGNLTVGVGQSLGLLGGTVVNTGQLNAPGGEILVQSVPGSSLVKLQRPGSLISLEVQPTNQASNPNRWEFPIASLPQLLANHAGQNATGLTVNAQGVVEITGSGVKVVSASGSTTLSGQVATTGETGGTINILGQQVDLVNAKVNASGNQNGGTIQVGGAYQGNSQLPSATRTTIDQSSTLNADSIDRGNGGSIIVWSQDQTAFLGQISARGGSTIGNGGFVEVSGKKYLTFQGQIDTGANFGKNGTVLLDPQNILIANSPANLQPGESFIDAASLLGAGSTTSFTLTADDNIRIAPNTQLDFGSGSGSLIFQADANGDRVGSFIMDPSSTIIAPTTIGQPGRSIEISGESISLGNITTRSGVDPLGASAGSVTLRANGNITTGYIAAFADHNPNIRNPGRGGDIFIESKEGSIDTRYGGLSSSASNGSAGNITLIARGDILTSPITTNSVSGDSPRSGDLTIISREGKVDLSATGVSSLNGTDPNQFVVIGSTGMQGGTLKIEAKGDVILSNVVGNSSTGTGSSIDVQSSNGNIEVKAGGRGISISSENGSSGSLSLKAPNGKVIIQDNILAGAPQGDGGNVNVLAGQGIEIQGTVDTSAKNTSGSVTFNGTTTLLADTAINSGNNNITFTQQVTGDHALNVSRANQLKFQKDVAVKTLTVNADSTEISGNVSTNNQPITFTKDVTLTAPVTFDAGTSSIDTGTNLNSGNNPLILKADTLNINGTVTGTNSLKILASSAGRNLELGNENTNALSLTADEISKINGFSSATYLPGDGGNLTFSAPITFQTPTILDPGKGSVFLNAPINSNNQELIFGNTVLGADIRISTGIGNITFTGTIDSQLDGLHQLTLNSGSGSIRFANAVGGNKRLKGLVFEQTSEISLNSDINLTTGDLNLIQPVTLTGDSTLSTNSGNLTVQQVTTQPGSTGNLTLQATSGILNVGNLQTNGGTINLTGGAGITAGGTLASNGGAISFNNPLTLSQDVTLNPTTGPILFNGTITGNYALNILNSSQVNFRNNISVGAINFGQAQSIVLNGNLSTLNTPITFNQPTNITTAATINAGTSTITINAPVNAASNPLNLKSNNLDITDLLSGSSTLNITTADLDRTIELGGASTPQALQLSAREIDQITGFSLTTIGSVTSTNQILASSPVSFNTPAVLEPGSNTVFLQADVNSAGKNLTLGRTVLGRDVQINTGNSNGNLTFNSTLNSQVDGGYQLTTSTGQGNLQFNGMVGGSGQRLRSLNISSANQVLTNGGVNITDGNLTIAQQIVLLGNSTFRTETGNLTVGNVTANTPADLSLQAPTGIVQAGNLDTSSTTGNAGSVSIIARESVTTGKINTSSTIGNAGNVFIDPLNDVVIDSINAQALGGGTGGNVQIFTQRYLRAAGTFTDRFGRTASISTADGGAGGSILIVHDGGARFTTFDVGFSDTNGLAGAITTGASNSILPTQFFPGPYQQGNIQIVTSPRLANLLSTIVPEGKIPELLELRRKEEGFGIDRYFTNQLEEFFKNQRNSVTVIKSLDEIQDELRKIEKAIGIRPAIIYAVFLPNGISEQSILYDFPQKFNRRGDNILHLVLVTGQSKPKVYAVPSVTRDLSKQTIDLLQDKLASSNDREQLVTAHDSPGQTFYQWLIAPLVEDLKLWKIQNLTFILDEHLRSTPISIMKKSDRFLLEDYSLGLMPSFSLTDTRFNPDFKKSKIMAMGTGTFTNLGLENLPAVPVELELIRRYLGGSDIQGTENLFKDAQFTPDNLLNHRKDAQIIHIASHAQFQENKADQSFIAFATGREKLRRMGQFKLYDPTVELIVLSACETALGDTQAELGFVGFAAEAGVKTSIGSLWTADDRGTLALMAEFYDQMQKSQLPIKAQALQKAQLALLKGRTKIENGHLVFGDRKYLLPETVIRSGATQEFTNPYFWAAFTLVGSPW